MAKNKKLNINQSILSNYGVPINNSKKYVSPKRLSDWNERCNILDQIASLLNVRIGSLSTLRFIHKNRKEKNYNKELHDIFLKIPKLIENDKEIFFIKYLDDMIDLIKNQKTEEEAVNYYQKFSYYEVIDNYGLKDKVILFLKEHYSTEINDILELLKNTIYTKED